MLQFVLGTLPALLLVSAALDDKADCSVSSCWAHHHAALVVLLLPHLLSKCTDTRLAPSPAAQLTTTQQHRKTQTSGVDCSPLVNSQDVNTPNCTHPHSTHAHVTPQPPAQLGCAGVPAAA